MSSTLFSSGLLSSIVFLHLSNRAALVSVGSGRAAGGSEPLGCCVCVCGLCRRRRRSRSKRRYFVLAWRWGHFFVVGHPIGLCGRLVVAWLRFVLAAAAMWFVAPLFFFALGSLSFSGLRGHGRSSFSVTVLWLLLRSPVAFHFFVVVVGGCCDLRRGSQSFLDSVFASFAASVLLVASRF